ncbi:MAG: cell envelope integrity protein TolA, partial [Pseudomonadota bacterium]
EIAPAPEPEPLPPDVPPAAVLSGRDDDRSNRTSEARWHPADGVAAGRMPAPDRGAGTGRLVEDPAWRRDASTLHERLTDGANVNRPSRAQTARDATSPQSVRREPRTGVGDSTRTTRPQEAAMAPRYGAVDPDESGVGSETSERPGQAMAAVDSTTAVAVHLVAPSVGPLDAEQGKRSHDVNAPAPVAADNRAQREASNEPHPSITDLSLAAVSGHGREGRGPSDMPGAVARASVGVAPAPQGARSTTQGLDDQQRAQERAYDRYRQDIQARVNRKLVVPRFLVVRLEQGETMLSFVVRPDGKLSNDAVQVTKSSGFVEFDRAGLDAVRGAAPFPPMPYPNRARPMPFSLRVTISNPLIR